MILDWVESADSAYDQSVRLRTQHLAPIRTSLWVRIEKLHIHTVGNDFERSRCYPEFATVIIPQLLGDAKYAVSPCVRNPAQEAPSQGLTTHGLEIPAMFTVDHDGNPRQSCCRHRLDRCPIPRMNDV